MFTRHRCQELFEKFVGWWSRVFNFSQAEQQDSSRECSTLKDFKPTFQFSPRDRIVWYVVGWWVGCLVEVVGWVFGLGGGGGEVNFSVHLKPQPS